MPVLNLTRPRRPASPLMTVFVVDCPYVGSCDFSAADIDPEGAHVAVHQHFETEHGRTVPALFKLTERA